MRVPGQDTAKLDKRQLMMEAMNEQLKEKAEQERRLQKLSKTLDHLERAKREEERPLLTQAYQEFLVEEEKWFHQQQKEKAELSAKQHALDIVEKQRLSRMLQDKVQSHGTNCYHSFPHESVCSVPWHTTRRPDASRHQQWPSARGKSLHSI